MALDLPTRLTASLAQLQPGWQALALNISKRCQHGDRQRWEAALLQLPQVPQTACVISDTVTITAATATAATAHHAQLREQLLALRPWRKGPFDILGVRVDTEWRSDMKWRRVAPHIDLTGHRVLDVGCGNGYYGWRMLEGGAACVVGIDPSLLFVLQHQAVATYAQEPRLCVVPLALEDLDTVAADARFDTVFSMGILYHRRDPRAHLTQLHRQLRSDGTLILETLTTGQSATLIPEDRYARMRNVWCVPSERDLQQWLTDANFRDVEILDVTITSPEEQRRTEWMPFESLAESLDPTCPQQTIEGYPAPTRALLKARKVMS